jgi:hypothetical protein
MSVRTRFAFESNLVCDDATLLESALYLNAHDNSTHNDTLRHLVRTVRPQKPPSSPREAKIRLAAM